ncbi:AsmA-like C-terminal region-containing protein [Bradyrhizobium sp. dw_78]|uniref:AsmA family protein n=1 Tax=Bradyrhizobium sp. dw_78 TaxID=2719793 RepID=UPI001BD609B7
MQTTLLGLAIALIIALVAALVGPFFIDWNRFRPQFEAEATRVIGAPVRVGGELDARLLPAPSLRLRSVTVGGANDLGKVRADKLDVEFSLGDLMRGQWRATELTIDGVALDLGLDRQGRIDWPASTGAFSLGALSIDRLNLTGRAALHDAASRSTLELNDIAFSGDVRSLAGSVRGDGNVTINGDRYPFRVSSGLTPDGNGTRIHLNIDPGARAIAADLEGVLGFDARAPKFDGALTLSTPAVAKPDAKPAGSESSQTPWRIVAKVKADPAGATLEQIEAGYGTEDRALKLIGLGDIRFGASPLLHVSLSARQLDADRLMAKDKDSDKAAAPLRLLPGLRALVAAVPQLPIPAQIEFSAEQIMLSGRPLQNITGEVHADAGADSWTIDRLNFRAPGATQVSLSGIDAPAGAAGGFREQLDVESSDPDTLAAWLQGRSDIAFRSQKPLRLHGEVSAAADRIAIEAMKAEIDGGAVEGRAAFSNPSAGGGSRFEAELKADRLDLDAATALLRSIAGPQGEWPDQAAISLDIDRAVSAGQELHPLLAKFSYGPKTFSLDRLKIGDESHLLLEGAGSFDRVNATGRLALNSTAASLGQITEAIKPFAPALASRLDAMGGNGAAHLKLALDLDKDTGHADRASARAVLDLDAPQFGGTITFNAAPAVAALRGMNLDQIEQSEFGLESKLSSQRGGDLLALLGLDRAVAAGDGPLQFQGSIAGTFGAPLRLKAKLSGSGLDAEAQGTAEPWAQEPGKDARAAVNLTVRHVNLTPLFDLKPSDPLAQNASLSSRVSLVGRRLSFDDLDGALAGARWRGHLAVTFGDARNVDGELGLDTLDLVPVFRLAIGSEGRDAADPLGAGLLKGWQGRVAFEVLRGVLPGGGELRPVSGTVKSDGQSLTVDAIKGKIGGGDATAAIDARPGADGIALNARVQLNGVDGAALHYRGLAMPAGRVSLQMALMAQGRSAAALASALSGNGTVTLDSATIAGLDPRVFDAAARASDSGQATDDARLRPIVDPILSSGALPVHSAQIPFTIRDGRLRVEATTLDTPGARAIISGGYDIPADQADIRASLAPTAAGFATGHPEIQLFAAGSPDRLDRTIDVSALSSWLAVRTIDRETRRLDAIERGERPPAAANPPDQTSVVPSPGREPHRIPLRPRITAPRPAPPAPPPPVVSQQVAPLPPPIEIRPAPGAAHPPKLRPPLPLTPPAAVSQ